MKDKFGFSREKTSMYALDSYSTPDHWYGLGCELQYNFIARFGDGVLPSEYKDIIAGVLYVFLRIYEITEERLGYDTWFDNFWLKELFGVNHTYPSGEKDSRPQELVLEQHFLFYVRVFWDKGAFDLRLLKKLEDTLEAFCVAKHTQLMLSKMIIIPRSKETMAAKIKANSERPSNIN